MNLKQAIKRTALAKPYIYAKGLLRRPQTQNEEAVILHTLLSRFDVPKSFVEFGFGGWEFNCAPLAYEWDGLLLDGDLYNITIARTILPKRVKSEQLWITLDTISVVKDWVGARDLGILSIDVDGNDYWFLNALIDLRPAIIIAEYNSTFQLRPIAIPYDPAFDYTRAHPSWLYYGASLSALNFLAEMNGYRLIEVGSSGINAFFVRSDLLSRHDRPLSPEHAYRDQLHLNGLRAAERWEKIKHLPFVDVTGTPILLPVFQVPDMPDVAQSHPD